MDIEIDEVKRLRKQHNLTQVQLSKLTGVSQSLIAKLESGKIDPSYTKVKKILDTLHSLSSEKEVKAGEIMIAKIIAMSPSDTVGKAIQKMKEHGISQLPVIDGKNVTGIISETGIIEELHNAIDPKALLVKDVMDEAPPIISKTTPVRIVVDLLRHSPMVIVSENGKVKGVITKADILKNYRG